MIISEGEEKLCITDLKYFKSEQGVGNISLFDRYNSLENIIKNYIKEEFQNFLARPVREEKEIIWFGKKFNETPQRLTDLTGEQKDRYNQKLVEILHHYREVIHTLETDAKSVEAEYLEKATKFVDERFVYCYDGRVVLGIWGIQLRDNVRETFGVAIREIFPFKVSFFLRENGMLSGKTVLKKDPDSTIKDDEIPEVVVDDGYKFEKWDKNPVNFKVVRDVDFEAIVVELPRENPKDEQPKVAQPEIPEQPIEDPIVTSDPPPSEEFYNVKFIATGGGKLENNREIKKKKGERVNKDEVPLSSADNNYDFLGWNEDPNDFEIYGDKTFEAQFKKKPWYRRLWTGDKKGCLKWLLWLLLLLLLIFLLSLLFRGCEENSVRNSNSHNHIENPVTGDDHSSQEIPANQERRNDINKDGGGIYNPADPYTPVPTPPNYNHILPPTQGSLPPIEDSDIISEPRTPRIVGNRLNVLMDNEDKSIMDLAKAFKGKYPGNEYKVIYYDDVVKRMQIEIPPEERHSLKKRIPSEFQPEYNLFVFDEALFDGAYKPNDPVFSDTNLSWYYKAVGTYKAWEISKGMESIVIAVVDNGFNLTHPEFAGKIVKPYNVWTQSKEVNAHYVDHGTHVGGIAVATADNNIGISGIAPTCKLMPIQVASKDGFITTTSVLDGILYGIYQGASVINVSLGTEFPELQTYPLDTQNDLMNNYFKEEERLWNKVADIAEKHSATLVVAAGNDNVLAGIEALQRPKTVIVVTALNKQNAPFSKADFSNYGIKSTVSAPGVDIYSCYGNNGYKVLSGTSMAAPIVSGAVALMKSLDNSLSNEEIICILRNTGTKTQGHVGPLIRIDKALENVRNKNISDCSDKNDQLMDTRLDDERKRLLEEKERLNRELERVNRALKELDKQ